jgi:hypothetical protein
MLKTVDFILFHFQLYYSNLVNIHKGHCMRRLLIISLICGALPLTSFAETTKNPQAFIGYYIGAGVGNNGQYIDTSYNNDYSSINTTATLGTSGLSGNIYGGYNFALNPMWLIGINLNGQYNLVNKSEHTSGSTHRDALMQFQYGVNIKLGLTPFASNLFYIFVGPTWAQIKGNYLRTLVDYTLNSTQLGVTTGFGASQNINTHVNITEQFSYAAYKSQKDTLADLGTFETTPTDSTFMLGIEYYF